MAYYSQNMGNCAKIAIHLKIRRYDTPEDKILNKVVEFEKNCDYNSLKREIQSICQVDPEDNKVIKLRTSQEVLVPLSYPLEDTIEANTFYYVDICKINHTNQATASLLQDAYIDSVCQKFRNMESRIIKAEMLLPQLEWRRQAHMEETVNALNAKVSFLNRRFDELLPPLWRPKMPQTMA